MKILLLKIYLLLYLFSQIKSQNEKDDLTLKEMKLNVTQSGQLDYDESHEYFILKIDKILENTTQTMLTFYIEENKTNIEEGNEIFSDPDVYVSKKNKYPSNSANSEWYSEKYGNDILTIPDIQVNDTFYVGIYCQFKCKYSILPSLSIENEFIINKPYLISMSKISRIYYFIKIPNEDYEEFNLIATSTFGTSFRIFISNESVSSQNTFNIMPSFINGYSISIDKNSKYYCKDCIYHIVLQSLNENTQIQINPYFLNGITKIQNSWPIYDSVKIKNKRCYSFDLSVNEKKYSEMIVQIILYNGNGYLFFHGWEIDKDYKLLDVKDKKYSFFINYEKSIMLNLTHYDYFDSEKESYKNKSTELFFCFYSTSDSSYYLASYNMAKSSILQIYNFISPEHEITGYLKNNSYTKYKILDYSSVNYKTKANISIQLTSINGNISAYGYYSKKNHLYITENTFQEELNNNNLIKGEKVSFTTYNILLKGEENECYKFNEENEETKKNETCNTYVIIKCLTEDYCNFIIRVSISESTLLMIPKKTYFSTIARTKPDQYEIKLNDPSFASLVIVLNSISGNPQLVVLRVIEKDGEEKKTLVGGSFNRDYIPDIVRITPKRLQSTNINGIYIVKITSSCFSSYSLYYYTTYQKDNNQTNQVNENDITSNLENGLIITDYFTNDTEYKIYSYHPNGKKEDIKIVLNSINIKFTFRVFLDLNTFNYTKNTTLPLEEKLKGYDWSCDSNGELIISASDSKFTIEKPYYIVVLKNQYTQNNEIDENAVIKYYLGVTSNNSHFLIYEGLEQTLTLTDTYNKQDYWYIHNDKMKTFELSINILSGEVNLFIDTQEISEAKIKNITNNQNNNNSSLVYILNIKDYDSIILDKEYFNKYCKEGMLLDKNSCSLYIKVKKANRTIEGISYAAQYIIVGKNRNDAEYLLPGIVRTDNIKIGEYKYYKIEEIQKRKGSFISISSENGYVEIYVKILDIPINISSNYPNETNYDYKGQDSHIGKLIYIPEKEFQKINARRLKLIILISVVGKSFSYSDDEEEEIEYTISYSSDPKRINQNTPYYNYISSGELQYFKFYFDEKTTNIYIALSNMNGDADLYLNYGDEILPTPELSDWNSTNIGHEYISININDEFFKKHNKSSLEGYYSLLVIGFTKTSYTLFISNYDITVYPLIDNMPLICKCKNKGDKCYFRYDDVYSDKNNDYGINENEIIFTTQYLYGNGMMYAKLLKDEDLYKTKKFYDNFPDENNSDFSTNRSNQRNYMKVKVSENNYFEDSIILMTLICDENTEVSITTASPFYFSGYDYIDYNRENIYYLKYNETKEIQDEIFLFFYYDNDNDLLYNIHTYTGSAKVRVFTNTSEYDPNTKKYIEKYRNISEFKINNNDKKDIHNLIKNSSKSTDNVIYFGFTPISDCGFFIQLLYDNSFVPITIGKNKNYLIKDNMLGYFDIMDEYSNIEFSLSLLNNKNKKATVYMKINIITKDSQQIFSNPEKSYHYNLPNSNNYDYKMETDPILYSLSINIEDLPKINNTENTFIRALFFVEITSLSDDIDEENEESTISIIISPQINNYKRIIAEPYQYYFNNITIFKNSEKVDKKIFALNRIDDSHNKMVIEISTCSGEYDFSLSNKIGDEKGNLYYFETVQNGRKIIFINNLKDKHIFLSIWPKKNIIFIQKRHYLSYMMFYYTISEEEYKMSFIDSTLTFKPRRNGGIKMTIPKIKNRDNQNNINDIDNFIFSAFITINPSYYNNMDSVCYLIRFFDNVDPKRTYRNININKNNEINLKDIKKGQTYYVNILAKNIETNEIISFKPIVVTYGNSILSYWKIVLIIIIIIIIILGLIYLIKKIRRVEILEKEVQNISNTSTTKSSSEMTYITPSSEIDNKL